MRNLVSTAPAPLKSLLRPAIQGMRELPVRAELVRQRRQAGGRVVFLPSRGREQSSLLRIYNVAAGLRPLGWQALVLPWTLTLAQRQRLIARFRPDVLVMQGARHGLNRPALYPEYTVVYDMDDADFHLPHLEQPVREAMGQVAGVIAGSSYVADWCRGQGANAHVVWTGTPVSKRRPVPQSKRPPVVAWAQTRPESYTREAEFVLEVMRRLSQQRPEVQLRLYDRQGQESGFLERFLEAGIRVEWRETCQYSDYLRSFDDVSLGLAPLCPETPFSRGKSFGKVLAYLDAHVPVIASDACEHGRFFGENNPALPNDPGRWAERMKHLLGNVGARQAVADNDFARFQEQLSLEAAARRVDAVLRRFL